MKKLIGRFVVGATVSFATYATLSYVDNDWSNPLYVAAGWAASFLTSVALNYR